ncbi:hypothetical protein AGABI1DRAFT_25694, partial [Agaricus bisporus var. burnettii JB137-S8]
IRLANSNFCLDAVLSPGNGTPMKIWQCFDDIPQQQWIVNMDRQIFFSPQVRVSNQLCV